MASGGLFVYYSQAQDLPTAGPAEKPMVASAPISPDSIDGAKKDFEAVKSLRDYGNPSKAETPRWNMPSLPNTPISLSPRTGQPQSEVKKAGSNWLVEAMQKKEPARPPGIDERRPADRATRSDEERTESQSAEAHQDRKEHLQTSNPFSRYLGTWMTPHDYSLLKPVFERSLSGEANGAKTSGQQAPGGAAWMGTDLVPQTTFGVAAEPGGRSAPRTPSGERENPFLEAIGGNRTPLANPPAAKGPSFPPPPVTNAGANAQIPGVSPGPPAKVPEFVRPTADEKYFKQLKRF